MDTISVTPTKQDSKVKGSPVSYYLSVTDQTLDGYQYRLPDKKSYLVLLPWPTTVEKPEFDADARYHNIKIMGKDTTQPRRTLCYGASYKYSGKYHPVDETPKDIQKMMDVTRAMYSKDIKVTTMCLANKYTTGYHYIGKHSDDEVQMSKIKDVVCWVTGAERRLIIRKKKESTIILEIAIPEGIYIMKGDVFQDNYTHEIPREKATLFNKMCKIIPKDIEIDEETCLQWLLTNEEYVSNNYKHGKKISKYIKQYRQDSLSDKGVLRLVDAMDTSIDKIREDKMASADWLANNPKFVKKHMSSSYDKYLEWREPRCSYTIRFFTPGK